MSLLNNSAFDSKRPASGKPILCYVTDRQSLQGAPHQNLFEPLLEKIEQVAAAGVAWIQLREKDLSGKNCAALARAALARISKLSGHANAATRLLLNDRLDVAFSEHTGGIHLGENSPRAEDARRLLLSLQATFEVPRDFLIGVSCHSLEAAKSAASAGADYIFFGPVFPTPSKTAYGPPLGLELLAEVCRVVPIPVLAIGGITLERYASCISLGASGIAAIRLFQHSSDLSELVRQLRQPQL